MAALRDSEEPIAHPQLATLVDADAERLDRGLVSLVADGLVQGEAGAYRLPVHLS